MDVYIIYGSETGNAQQLAERCSSRLNELGISAGCAGMEDISLDLLSAMPTLLIITSTWGEGDPPSNAAELHYRLSKTERRFDKLHYAVFAIGMASFEHFCQAGRDFDDFLAAAGAQRLLPLTTSDDRGEEDVEPWIERLYPLLLARKAALEG